MPNYKLIYFSVKGRAELIRLTFHAGGIKFEDQRIDSKDWPALKEKMPNGMLPVLDIDGQLLGQSMAIARYVAKQAGLYGKTPMEESRIDELVETVGDFAQALMKRRFEKDEARKAELSKDLQEKIVPKYKEKLNNLLKDNRKFFVGTSLTLADLAVYNTLDILTSKKADILDDKAAAELKAFKKRIEDIPSIRSYLKARPVTEF